MGLRNGRNTLWGLRFIFIFAVVVVHSLSCVWLCNPMDCSTPGFPVSHYLPEFAQVLVHWVSDSICSSFATLFSFAFQSFIMSGSFPMTWLFTSGGQSIRALTSASVFIINIQSRFPLGLIGLISLLSKGLLGVFSSITVPKHQFFST